ncbi:amidohydrolase [Nocardioides solisilvae]|uniref:amidohydrolase n=1 Tax=Nocardioides solisilvae TaxID=1542435 RepID=UPI000D74A889|nr:amidohydrolase family protein [Nocardioides solisilvae]
MTESAHLLLRDVRLVPVRPGDAVPDAPVDLRLRDGRVAEVAPGLDRDGAEEVRAEGRWVVPGLWDQHVHLGQWTLSSARLDLAPVRSAAEAVRMVADRLAEWPDLPVIGWGHRPTAWPEDPVVSMLDALGSDQPVVLIAGDGHHAWLNTVALKTLHLPLREGVVSELEWFDAYGRLSSVLGDDGTGPDAYRRTMEQAAALGVVGLTDFEFSGGHEDWARRWEAGADLLRLRMATYAAGLDDVVEAGLRTGDVLPGCSDLARMGPLKIISDGSLNTRTAWCCEPYAGPAPLGFPHGNPNQSPEELAALLARGRAQGLTAAVHAIGDRAVTAALDAFAATGIEGTIEHAQLVRREDVRRMAELGIVASVQPAHLLDDRDVSERLWPGRGDRCFALRWMLDDGVTLAMGSDAPVARLDPWLAMAAAVHRTADDREPWHPEQAITAQEALAASVDGLGTVAAGHPADLVLLDADPLAPQESAAATGEHLRGMGDRVAGTWVAGVRVHDPEASAT